MRFWLLAAVVVIWPQDNRKPLEDALSKACARKSYSFQMSIRRPSGQKPYECAGRIVVGGTSHTVFRDDGRIAYEEYSRGRQIVGKSRNGKWNRSDGCQTFTSPHLEAVQIKEWIDHVEKEVGDDEVGFHKKCSVFRAQLTLKGAKAARQVPLPDTVENPKYEGRLNVWVGEDSGEILRYEVVVVTSGLNGGAVFRDETVRRLDFEEINKTEVKVPPEVEELFDKVAK